MVAKGDILADKYLLESFLGSGGFASVWAARNVDIDRPVALKILTENLARVPDVVTRFVREATIAAKQIHPTILRVEDIAKTRENIPFLVMELLVGQTLGQTIKARGALPIAECVEIARHVLDGLSAAHDRGIIHRDIKPSNIFLTSPSVVGPRVRILDLGLAKDIRSETGVTSSGQWMGTPDYLPPELFLADQWRELGPTGDVFAFGVTLFEMLTGRRPLDGLVPHGRSPSMLFKRISYYESHAELPRALELVRDLPVELDSVVRGSLAVEPSRRFSDAGRMLEALERAIAGMRERYPTFSAMPCATTDLSPAPAIQEVLPETKVDRPGLSSSQGEFTEELLSGDLLLEDPSITPTSSRRIAIGGVSSDGSWSDPSRLHAPPLAAAIGDGNTSELLEPTRRSPAPSPPASLGSLLASNGLEAASSDSAIPSLLRREGAPWHEDDPGAPREPRKGRSLVLALSLGAMAISLVILVIVAYLTLPGPSQQASPTTLDLPQDPSGVPSETEMGILIPNSKNISSDSRSAGDGGPTTKVFTAELEADGGADVGARDEARSTQIVESPTKVQPRDQSKRSWKRHKIRRPIKRPNFDSAIPFDKLGQQAGSSSNDGTR